MKQCKIKMKEQNNCWLYEENFKLDNEGISDHFHLTGKYRRAAHQVLFQMDGKTDFRFFIRTSISDCPRYKRPLPTYFENFFSLIHYSLRFPESYSSLDSSSDELPSFFVFQDVFKIYSVYVMSSLLRNQPLLMIFFMWYKHMTKPKIQIKLKL